MPAHYAAGVALLIGILIGMIVGLIAARDVVRKRRTQDRITRGTRKAAKTGVERPTMIRAGILREVDETIRRRLRKPEPDPDAGPLPYALQSRIPTPLARTSPLVNIEDTGTRLTWTATPIDEEAATPPDKPWQQPLPDTDARGVAAVPGPIDPGQRLSRVVRESTGEQQRVPGEQTTWLGRHHLPEGHN